MRRFLNRKLIGRTRMLEKVNKIKFPNGRIGKVTGSSIIVEDDEYSIEIVLDDDYTDIREVILLYNTRERFPLYLKKDTGWTKKIQRDFKDTYAGGSWIGWIKEWLSEMGCEIIRANNTYNVITDIDYAGSVYIFVHFEHPEKGEGVVVMWHLGGDVRGNYSAPEVWFGDFEEIFDEELLDYETMKEEVAHKLGYGGDWDALVDDVISQVNK